MAVKKRKDFLTAFLFIFAITTTLLRNEKIS